MSRLTRRNFLTAAGVGAGGVVGLSLLQAYGAKIPNLFNRRKQEKKLNAIIIILDSLRKDHIGIYGNRWIQTPNLDALARESLRFNRAYPESTPTIPARRAIHTGLRSFPFRNWVPQKGTLSLYGWQRIPEDQTTLAEILQSAGYETLLVTDCYHQFRPSMNFNRGFSVERQIHGQEEDPYQPYWLVSKEQLERYVVKGSNGASLEWKLKQYLANTAQRKREEDWFAPQVFRAATELLDNVSQEQPFFMVIDVFDPHEPWDPPRQYVDLYDKSYNDLEPMIPSYGPRDYLTDRQLKRMQALYAGEVTLVDRWLGQFLAKAKDLNLMENTVLFLLSDHGMTLGERGLTGKISDKMGPELTNIPLFLRHPNGKGAGQTSEYFASTHDIAPTILAMLHLKPPAPMDGQNLALLLDGKEPVSRPYVTLSYNEHIWIRDERYALLCHNTGAEATLYDLQTDPGQTQDIATDHPDIVKRLYGYALKDAGGQPLPTYNT